MDISCMDIVEKNQDINRFNSFLFLEAVHIYNFLSTKLVI